MRNQEWIAVSEKLPEITADYLVTDGKDCTVSTFEIRSKKWNFWDIDWLVSIEVTHWMPLPELPQN